MLRDLVRNVPISADLEPATFADGDACMEVIDAIRRSAFEGGLHTGVGAHS